MRRSTILAALLLIAVALAGCHEPSTTPMDPGTDDADGAGNGTDDPDPEPLEVTLRPRDPPTTVTAEAPVNLTVEVTTTAPATSTHSGFHWGFNSSAGADPEDYTIYLTEVSPHVLTETQFPGTYTVEGWTFGEQHVGETVYYRAHTIIGTDHYWGEELSFIVIATV